MLSLFTVLLVSAPAVAHSDRNQQAGVEIITVELVCTEHPKEGYPEWVSLRREGGAGPELTTVSLTSLYQPGKDEPFDIRDTLITHKLIAGHTYNMSPQLVPEYESNTKIARKYIFDDSAREEGVKVTLETEAGKRVDLVVLCSEHARTFKIPVGEGTADKPVRTWAPSVPTPSATSTKPAPEVLPTEPTVAPTTTVPDDPPEAGAGSGVGGLLIGAVVGMLSLLAVSGYAVLRRRWS